MYLIYSFLFKVSIIVVDKNDNAPEFLFNDDVLSTNQFLVSIQDNTPAGSNIIQIQVGYRRLLSWYCQVRQHHGTAFSNELRHCV